MEFVIGIFIGILVGAIGFWIFNRKQRDELDSLKAENEKISTDLGEAKQGNANLENRLEKADAEIATLESSLTEKTTQIDTLTNQLGDANTQIDTLNNELKKVSGSNGNAIHLLLLFELSLRLNAFALYCAISNTTSLGKEYKELHEAYKKLHEAYKKLHEEVKEKTKKRMMRSGIGTALSLLPGVGIFQLVADLTDLANFANEVAEETANFQDVISAIDNVLNVGNSLAEFIHLAEIGILHSEILSDQEREKALEAYQKVFNEAFQRNHDQGAEAPDGFDFDNFSKNLIKLLKEHVDSMPEDETQDTLSKIVDNFRQFGITHYTYHKSLEANVPKSSPAPKK